MNTEDDATINNELISNFNKSTGLWSYKSESTNKSMFSDDKNISAILSTVTLMHLRNTANLYTCVGLAHIQYHGLRCNKNSCQELL